MAKNEGGMYSFPVPPTYDFSSKDESKDIKEMLLASPGLGAVKLEAALHLPLKNLAVHTGIASYRYNGVVRCIYTLKGVWSADGVLLPTSKMGLCSERNDRNGYSA